MTPDRRILIVPAAIVGAGLILAISVYVMRSSAVPQAPTYNPQAVRAVNPEIDHIVGNPDAPVVIVEYSDIDSRYGKSFHRTMAQLMTEYGPGGQVAWVYRHLPLIDVHPNAALHAEAAECVASLAGDEAFWNFINLVHAAAPEDNQFYPEDYPPVIAQLGVDAAAFTACMDGNQFEERINDDFNNALQAGAEGAPYIVLLVEGKKPEALEGALPYLSLKRIIDESIAGVSR